MKRILDQIIDQFTIEIYVVDADTLQILYLNHAAEANIGYTFAELEHHTLVKLAPHTTVADLKDQMSVLRTNPETKEILLGNMVTRKDGTRYPITAKIQFDEFEGRPAFIGLIQDATEKQLALDQLHYVLKSFSLGFWDWNIELDTYYVDDRWLEMLGYQRGEIRVCPQSIINLVHVTDRLYAQYSVNQFMLYDDNFAMEFRLLHKQGHTQLRCSGNPRFAQRQALESLRHTRGHHKPETA